MNKGGLVLLPVPGQLGQLKGSTLLGDFCPRSLPPCHRGRKTGPSLEQQGGVASSGWKAAGQRENRHCRQHTQLARLELHNQACPSPGDEPKTERRVLKRNSLSLCIITSMYSPLLPSTGQHTCTLDPVPEQKKESLRRRATSLGRGALRFPTRLARWLQAAMGTQTAALPAGR